MNKDVQDLYEEIHLKLSWDTKENLEQSERHIMFLDFKELNFITMHSFLN